MSIPVPDSLRTLMNRPVAVFGGGVSGAGVRALLSGLGIRGVVYDRAPGCGLPFSPEAAAGHDLAVYSPGFPSDHPWLRMAREASVTCMPEIDFGSQFVAGSIVAVTGTNGKTTLTEFLAHALRTVGQPALVAGNIAPSLSETAVRLAGDRGTVVCEVSSFQAESAERFCPSTVLWTNFAEDHLDRHGSLTDYFRAKRRLFELAAADAVLAAGAGVFAAAAALGEELPPTVRRVDDVPGPAGTLFAGQPQAGNFSMAAHWWQERGLPATALAAAARDFRAGAHRLEPVGEVEGAVYWNDSKATNFHAVEGALAAFDRPVLWIGGGRSKGGDIEAFVERIHHRIKGAWLIGETRFALAAALDRRGVTCAAVDDLDSALGAIRAVARHGDHIVFSPGFASFDQYQDYIERGERFRSLVTHFTVATRNHPSA